jgi:hypothetical protein
MENDITSFGRLESDWGDRFAQNQGGLGDCFLVDSVSEKVFAMINSRKGELW